MMKQLNSLYTTEREQIKERAAVVEKAIIEALKKQEKKEDPVNAILGEYLGVLTDSGKNDLEMYADACKDIVRAIKQDKKAAGAGGEIFLDRLPKYTRNHILVWMDKWEHFFKGLSFFKSVYILIDYIDAHYCGTLTLERLESLETTYL